MTASAHARKVSVLPGIAEVIAGIAAAGVVPDPAIVAVDVGNVRVPVVIAVIAVLIVLRSRSAILAPGGV
jgi:hypothetical protein